jgi:hypothetical protein
MKDKTVILIRVKNGIGIDSMGRGYTVDGKLLKRKFYSGRLCYLHGSKVIGYKTLAKSEPVRFEIKNDCPF